MQLALVWHSLMCNVSVAYMPRMEGVARKATNKHHGPNTIAHIKSNSAEVNEVTAM